MNRVAKKSQRQTGRSGSVRIISGQWRGRRLPVLDAEGLRPSTDRTRETLFNWLMADIQDAKILDVFAGSGVLGLESLSRYASEATFIEKNGQAVNQLKKNLTLLKAQATVHQGDALQVLTGLTHSFDVIFIDPPFQHDLVNPTLAALQNNGLIAGDAKIYVEQEANAPQLKLPQGLSVLKQKHTGQLSYYLLTA